MRTILLIGRRCAAITYAPSCLKATDSHVKRVYQTSTTKVPFYGAPRELPNDNDLSKNAASRWKLAATSALSAWWDPTRAGDVATLGNITGTYALYDIHAKMKHDPTGRRILQDRPLVNRQHLPQWIVDHATGMVVSDDHNNWADDKNRDITFGQAYADFLRQHGFDPDERSPVQHIDDSELAYIMLRYRQVRDKKSSCDVWATFSGERYPQCCCFACLLRRL